MTAAGITVGERAIAIEDVVVAARGPLRVSLSECTRRDMAAARAVVDAHASGDVPVYGLNTGVGDAVGQRIPLNEVSAFQEKMVRACVAGVGEPLPLEICRAALFCRIAALARCGAGISPHLYDLMVAMLERDVIPVMPSRGSLGTGDVVMLMCLANVLVGRGQAWYRGKPMPGAAALADAGLAPVKLAAKDGLSVGSASGVTCAMAALSLDQARSLLSAHVATAAFACEGYGANPRIFDARIAAARPAAAQEAAAALFRRAMDGSSQYAPGAARVQDALSFRTLPQVGGSTLGAFEAAREAVEIELNAAADNPLVMSATGEIHSTANFHTGAIALAFDALAIAMAHLANASAHRSMKLMSGRLSGLPHNLSPVGGASAGFASIQMSIAALQAEIRLKAQPASLDSMTIEDTVEDVAPHTPLTIRKFNEQMDLVRWLISIEALLAAQACDLRASTSGDLTLGRAGRVLQPLVRSVANPLVEDRETGPDAEAVHATLWSPAAIAAIDGIFAGVPSPVTASTLAAPT